MKTFHPIRGLNAWRIGGTVRRYSLPTSKIDLLRYYEEYCHERTIWLGLGSNVLFGDELLEAHVIHTIKALRGIDEKQGCVVVEAGVSMAKAAKFCISRGYIDAAFLAGIPGTIGGGLFMNAGAYGYEIWQFVESIEALTTQGVRCYQSKDFRIGYRGIQGPSEIIMFLSAVLRFKKDSPEAGRTRVRQYLTTRNQTQPIGTYNCGSVFKNPKGASAGKMIDELGLLGYQVGHARISPKHGNFIENLGQAQAQDIKTLIRFIQTSCYRAFQKKLALEVKIYDNI